MPWSEVVIDKEKYYIPSKMCCGLVQGFRVNTENIDLYWLPFAGIHKLTKSKNLKKDNFVCIAKP